MNKTFLSLLLILSGGYAAAQDVNGDGRITYLVPINVPRPTAGAMGTTWQTELWIHNGSEMPLNILGCPFISVGSFPCEGIPFHAVGVSEKAFSYETIDSDRNFSALMFSLYPWQNGVIVKSRLYELSRHAQPAGVEIPVVREDQFFTKPSRFIGIPHNSAVRVALRVYDPRRRSDARVRVELFDESGASLDSSTLALIPATIDSISPGYAAIYDVGSTFPQLAGVERFDIRVTPLTPGMEYWAFVSVTDQHTQQVLLVTAD